VQEDSKLTCASPAAPKKYTLQIPLWIHVQSLSPVATYVRSETVRGCEGEAVQPGFIGVREVGGWGKWGGGKGGGGRLILFANLQGICWKASQ